MQGSLESTGRKRWNIFAPELCTKKASQYQWPNLAEFLIFARLAVKPFCVTRLTLSLSLAPERQLLVGELRWIKFVEIIDPEETVDHKIDHRIRNAPWVAIATIVGNDRLKHRPKRSNVAHWQCIWIAILQTRANESA